ncbi:MAG TPA: haloacid dehalogenase type II [Dongiaceae bacterium]|nr:haloacid dehalogenase type II [Dongiaceae bacterium]
MTIKALTFDVFGTVVDWRTTIIDEVSRLGGAKGNNIDPAGFADVWRAGYKPAMDRVRRGELPWMNLDALHRMLLDRLLREFGISGMTETEKERINRVWHRLKAWPDSVGGLARLRKRFIVAALSNGNMSLLTNLSRNAGLSWDRILSAELAGHYKPDKEVYQMAADLLKLRPGQVMMVAAHKEDLRGAQAAGFKTAFVLRPLEYGPAGSPDPEPDPAFDIIARDFNDLAEKLGV